MRAILLPNGNLLIPVEPDDPNDGPVLKEIGPEHPEYGRWLARAEEGENPREAWPAAAARCRPLRRLFGRTVNVR